MSPWTLLGWLLVGLFCLLLAAGLYLIGALWGWPSWTAPLVGGCCLAAALTVLLYALWKRSRAGSAPTAPVAAQVPVPAEPLLSESVYRIPAPKSLRPCLLLVNASDDDIPGAVLEDAASISLLPPLTPPEQGSLTLWTTDPLRWLAVSAPQRGTQTTSFEEKTAAPAPEAHSSPPPPPLRAAGWDALLRWDSASVERLLGGCLRGVVLVLPAALLVPGEHLRETAEHLRRRLRELTNRFGALPIWLLWTGLEELPGGRCLAEHLESAASTRRAPLREPLGWQMPPRSKRQDAALRVAAAAQRGLDSMVQALDALVRTAEAGQEPERAPGAFLLGRALEDLADPLGDFTAYICRDNGPDLHGIFWIGLLKENSGGNEESAVVRSLFAARLMGEKFPEYARREGDFWNRPRRIVLLWGAVGLSVALLTGSAGFFLEHAARESRLALQDMEQLSRLWNATLNNAPQALHEPAMLYHMACELQRLDNVCSGAAKLYGAPSRVWARLRPATLECLEEVLSTSEENVGGDTSGQKQDATDEVLLTSLMRWAGTRPEVTPLAFRDPGGTILAEVNGGATANGRRAAQRFFNALEAVLPHYGSHIALLRQRYDDLIFATWQASGIHLLRAVYAVPPDQPLGTAPEIPKGHIRSLSVPDMLGPDNPCDAFLDAALRELRPALEAGEGHPWAESLQALGRVRTLLRLPAVRSVGDWKRLAEVGGMPQSPRDTLARAENLFRARTAWADYAGALAALRPEAASSQGLIRLARSLYAGTPTSEGPSLSAAADTWRDLRERLLIVHLGLNDGNGFLWLELLRGPLQFAADAAVLRAAQDLQYRWTTEVINPVENLEGDALRRKLSGENNLLQTFAEGPARPFLRASSEGLTASTAMGRRFPLSSAFLRCLNETPRLTAPHPASFPVRVHLLPVTVNAGATVHPRGVVLQMNCGKERFQAAAYNYPESVTVDWSPERCGDLKLDIRFDDFTLSSVFEGPLGFARFASQASHGIVYGPTDFPRYRQTLETLNVSRIRAGFRVEGAAALLPLLRETDPALPRFILQE